MNTHQYPLFPKSSPKICILREKYFFPTPMFSSDEESLPDGTPHLLPLLHSTCRGDIEGDYTDR